MEIKKIYKWNFKRKVSSSHWILRYGLALGISFLFVYQNCATQNNEPFGASNSSSTPCANCSSCTFNGVSYSNGAIVSGYIAAQVSSGQTCTSATANCVNGVLSRTLYPTCQVGSSSSSSSTSSSSSSGSGTYSLETVIVEGSIVSDTNTGLKSEAVCPSTHRVVGGGFRWVANYGAGTDAVFERDSYPNSSNNSWVVNMQYAQFSAYAICLRLLSSSSSSIYPTVTYVRSSSTVSTGGTGGTSNYATCPSGSVLVGGGHEFVGPYGGCDKYIFSTYDGPDSGSSGTTWKTTMVCSQYLAHGVCLSLPSDVGTLVREVPWGDRGSQNSGAGVAQSSVAYCSSGRVLTGGGHSFAEDYQSSCEASRYTIISRPYVVDSQTMSYIVQMECSRFNAIAICLQLQ